MASERGCRSRRLGDGDVVLVRQARRWCWPRTSVTGVSRKGRAACCSRRVR